MLIMIAASKLHKSVIAITAGVIFFISRYVTVADVSKYSLINLDFIVMIAGMSIIASFMKHSGIFQFLVLKAVRKSGWNCDLLSRNICVVILLLSAFFCDRIAVVLMFPIVAFIFDSLNLELNNTIMGALNSASIGGVLLSISGAEVILISTAAKISFTEYLTFITPALFVVFIIYIFYMQIFMGGENRIDAENTNFSIIKFNEEMAILGPNLFSKLLLILISTITILCFSSIMGLSDSVIIITGAALLFLTIELSPDKVLKEIKLNIFFYILGLQIVAAAFYKYHIYDTIALQLTEVFGHNGFYVCIFILVSGAVLSLAFGRLSMTFLFLPVISILTGMGFQAMPLYSSFIFSMAFARSPTMLREIPKVLKNTHIEEKNVWEHYSKLFKKTAVVYFMCFAWFVLYVYLRFFYNS
mgnify:CR=1 FL=1